MKTLTVITTTYNRAYCLHQVYESLLRQDTNDFIWLVVDDGSTDDTKEKIEVWKAEGKVDIQYAYKPNGGMHTARNFGYELVKTELNVIIDSDDWMPDNVISKVIQFWIENKRDNIAGIIALDAAPDGKVIGSSMPKNIRECHYREFFGKYKGYGDKKLIYRSELTRLYPYPEYPGEKFYPASYKFMMLDQKYTMLLMDEVVCIADYNPDSMTYAKYAQYKKCAKGFAHFRNETMRISKDWKYIMHQIIHYLVESRFAGERHYIQKCSRPIWAILFWLPGYVYYLFLTHTRRKY
ncbi:MAG: glycosyltransferase family 2 protein [Victivallales bacterium]|nr:glycosyltransferase family 2 protein [Victivallales bacterium]